MDRLSFAKQSGITDYEFFANNYDAIQTVYTICHVCNEFDINNLSIIDNVVRFNLKKKKVPEIKSCTIYGSYSVDFNITNDSIEVIMRVSA